MICPKRWSVFFFKKTRRLVLRHNKWLPHSISQMLYAFKQSLQIASDEMPETSDYTNLTEHCQARLCTIVKLFVELPFSITANS